MCSFAMAGVTKQIEKGQLTSLSPRIQAFKRNSVNSDSVFISKKTHNAYHIRNLLH